MNESFKSQPQHDESIEEQRRPKAVTTARGSVYTYLEDGTTQRYKKAEESVKEPQNVLVFIPKITELVHWKHYPRLPEWMKELNNNQVMEILSADYIRGSGKTVILTDEVNQIIHNNDQAREAKELLLHFVDRTTNQTEFALPVSAEPQIGHSTYDARYFEKDGEQKFSCHIGNEVVSIEYESD